VKEKLKHVWCTYVNNVSITELIADCTQWVAALKKDEVLVILHICKKQIKNTA